MLKLGHHVTLTEKTAKGSREISGTVVAVKLSWGVMRTDEGDFKAVQFQIRDTQGHNHWSKAFADKKHEYTDPIKEEDV